MTTTRLGSVSGAGRRFTLSSIPLGDYIITVSQTGFATMKQTLTLASDTAPIMHFEPCFPG